MLNSIISGILFAYNLDGAERFVIGADLDEVYAGGTEGDLSVLAGYDLHALLSHEHAGCVVDVNGVEAVSVKFNEENIRFGIGVNTGCLVRVNVNNAARRIDYLDYGI